MRAAAAAVVARVLRERIEADDALAAAEGGVAQRDRALLGALVFGALRWHQRFEWQAARLLTKPLKPGQLELGALLKVGLLQLQEMRIPEHAAVSATVDATALLGSRNAAPLVNAVLRRFQRERPRSTPRSRPTMKRGSAIRAGCSSSSRTIGPTTGSGSAARTTRPRHVAAGERAANDTRRRTSHGSKPRASALGRTQRVATAIVLDEPQPVDALPGFAAGDARFKTSRPSARRASSTSRRGSACSMRARRRAARPVTSWNPARASTRFGRSTATRAGSRESARTSIGFRLAARLVAGDATRPEGWWDGRPFDRILLDAPCSAVGVIRRHPDIKVLRRPEDVARAVLLQSRLLRALWPLLAPGGRLVYATCSVLRSENDAQIAAFLSTAEASEGPGTEQLSGCQSLPGDADGDGFYYACLLKPAAQRPLDVFHAQQ